MITSQPGSKNIFLACFLGIGLLLFPSGFVYSQPCHYILSMHDSYGDGWNGGHLEVFVNGNSAGTFYATGFGSTAQFEISNGDLLELYYTAGEWENENSYQLFNPAWILLFADGPNPETGLVYTSTGNCEGTPFPGNHPCTAIVTDTGCIVADNTGYPGSGINPGCADYQGSDIWFTLPAPSSGNLSIVTDNGNLTDTGLAAWSGNSCTDIHLLGCDDDGGNGYYSMLTLYDLDPGQPLYIQVFGYGGGTGTFELCISDLGQVVLDSTELPIIMINTLGQTIPHDEKINALMDIKYNGPGNITRITDPSNVYSGNIGIEIRGATSAWYPQTPYNIETRTESGGNNNVSLLGMPPENDWVLLSNFNDRSLIRNTLAFRFFEKTGNYSTRTHLCEVLIDSSYKGIYVFGEKIKRDNNRVDIANLLYADTIGDELTGGYILQQNYWTPETSFQSNYSPIDHPGFDVHFVYEFPKPDTINAPQKAYIAAYVDSLETALYSDDFADPVNGYRKYLDVKSFIDYFFVNELSRNNDGFKKSVFFHKDKFSNGGKMKAGPVWDFDWAWKNLATCDLFDNLDGSGWAYLINDCPTDNYSCGWYVRMLMDSTFTRELRCTWEEYRQEILDTATIFAYIDSVRYLVQNAQARHFQKWPILGISGPAPEIGEIATTYNAELDTLKAWIQLRMQWLDANMPGLCFTPASVNENRNTGSWLKCYPNPTDGMVHFEGFLTGETTYELQITDVSGKLTKRFFWPSGKIEMEYKFDRKGVYFYQWLDARGIAGNGKIMVY